MKYYRFMSKNEFEKLINGETLKNDKKHQAKTNSVGFCFMKYDDYKPKDAYEFMSGIVSEDICVVFETTKKLTKSYGVYADPDLSNGWFASITVDEYCIKEYSLQNFKIVEMLICNGRKHFETQWKYETDISKALKKLDKIEKQKLKKEEERNTKKQLEEKYREAKEEEIIEVLKHIQKEQCLEVKLGDKYYKVPMRLEQMTADNYAYEFDFKMYLKR